jgi:molybdenum cofactor synthesis domain-containing protein
MRCAVLTISTSVAAGDTADRSGELLVSLAREIGAEVVNVGVVADRTQEIEAWLREQVAQGVELALTTGGTGLTADDVTPEATRAVIEREVPGIAEAMRAESMRRTPMGMLSRALAGAAGKTLIINFPGSPRAVEELFGVIAPVLGHAVALLHRERGQRVEH